MAKYLLVLFVACSLQLVTNAQDNSPYSRYGLGDITPNQNILNRGMGGVSAGMFDYQSINFVNPAAIGGITNTIFDIGAETDIRGLKSTSPAKKFTAVNSLFSYLQLGFPIASEKMKKKGMSWGMSFGLRPVSRINYKIEKNERLTGIDSLNTVYEGNGGVNQAFLSTGIKKKDWSIGVSAGYMFGSKDYSTKLTFINDSVDYFKSNSSTTTTFGGVFVNLGMLYDIKLKSGTLRLGAYGNWKQRLNAKRDLTHETIAYDANGGTVIIDSVYQENDVKGTIEYPSVVGVGFTYQNKNWVYGADFEISNWANYRYYGQTDLVQNNWIVRAGAQYFPAKENTSSKKYFSFVRYRAGLYYGPDYIKVNASRPIYGLTIGTGMPLTTLQRLRFGGEYVVLNTAIEVGGRGNKNTNLKENIMRFSIGVSMNARWFVKPKYD